VETARDIRLFEKLRIKKTKILTSLTFLLRCKDQNVHSTHVYLPVKMEHCSETSAYKFQTSGNYPKENIPQMNSSPLTMKGTAKDVKRTSLILLDFRLFRKEVRTIFFRKIRRRSSTLKTKAQVRKYYSNTFKKIG
jgi:hypothetical protein